jgi:hypothetical protein
MKVGSDTKRLTFDTILVPAKQHASNDLLFLTKKRPGPGLGSNIKSGFKSATLTSRQTEQDLISFRSRSNVINAPMWMRSGSLVDEI